MAINYTIESIGAPGEKNYSAGDTRLSSNFNLNSRVDLKKDKIETHFLDLDDNLIDSIYDSINIQTNQDSGTAANGSPSTLKLNPKEDVINNGFGNNSIKVVYNFLNNLYSETNQGGKFFIETISEDRTELRLLSTEVSSKDIITYTDRLIKDLESNSFYDDFRLNTRNNKLLLAINIKTEDYRKYKAVIVKLYEPLPEEFQEKTILTIEKKVADTVAYEVTAIFTPDPIKVPYLKGPNFIITDEESASPTSYLNYQELFDFPTNNSYRELNSLFSEKSISLSIDYSDFSNFAHFSSVEERLKNFQYKLNLVEEYQVSSSQAAVARSSGSTTFLSGSDIYWKDKLDGIINNFDHYDRHLYFGSGSTSWPKQSPQTKPYIQATGSATGSFVDEYFGGELSSGSKYDDENANLLINTVPEYIRDDNDSVKYSTFIHMLAQHFDNLYIYSKALSDKYDNDNRLDFGASKDLIQDLLKNFGVKIYNNVRSAESLFDIYSGQIFQTGSDTVTNLISASDTPISTENYRNEIHKRVYHNLPYLLKTKGTERGLKALIASFGLPTDNNIIGSGSNINGLYVRTFGGGEYTGSFNSGPLTAFTSSLGKIRIDNTGSIVEGDTLSQFASIVTRDKKYSDDIHSIEVGFSPTYELNESIISASSAAFNIDNFIGDPGQAYSGSYYTLVSESNALLNPETSTGTVASEIGDGFKVANVSHVNNFASGDYQYRVQLSQSVQNSGSNPHNPDSDASDIPKANNSGYLKADGGGYVAVNNSPSWGLVQASTGTKLNAVNNSNTFTLTSSATGQIYPGGIVRQQGDSTYSGSINGQTVTEVKLDGAANFKKHNVSFSNSNNNIIAFKVTGGPHTIPAGTELNISQTQWEMHTDTQIDDSIYSLSGSYGVGNMFGYTVSTTTVGHRIGTSSLKPHNYGELVRYLRYYDNVLFKMIKDFVPARANVDTGLIIKPHILERNKIKQVQGSFESKQYTGSIDTAFVTSSDGSSFTNKIHEELTIPLTASYSETIVTSHVSGGLVPYHYHEKERTRYDGEFSGSQEIVYQHTLNDANDWKYTSPTNIFYKPLGVEKLACPTLTLLSVTGSYSPNQFIFSGSFEAVEAGTYYIDIRPSSHSTYAQSLTPIVITEAQNKLWNTTSTLGFSELTPGTLYPTASMYYTVDGAASDCGTVTVLGDTFEIAAQPEVCPVVTTSGFRAETGFSGSDYSPLFPGGYSNPSGLRLIMSGTTTQLPDGDPIKELGWVIGTTNPPTVSGSGTLFQGWAATNGGGPAGQIGEFYNISTRTNSMDINGNTEWIEPNTTYYIRTYASASSTCGTAGPSGSYVYGNTLSDTTGASTYIASESYDFGSVSTGVVCDNFHNDSGNNTGYFWTYSSGTFGVPFDIATHLYTAPIATNTYAAPSNFYVSGSRQGTATVRTIGSNGAFTTSANCAYTP